MEASTILPLVWYYLLTIFIVSLVYSYFRSWYRLRDFKGPWLASLTEGWLFGNTTKGDLHMRLYEVSKKYGLSIPATAILPASLNQICIGDLARVGPNWLVTSDPDIIRYMSAARYKHRKSSWYAALQVDPFLHSVFTETSLEKHDRLRTKVQPGVRPSYPTKHCIQLIVE